MTLIDPMPDVRFRRCNSSVTDILPDCGSEKSYRLNTERRVCLPWLWDSKWARCCGNIQRYQNVNKLSRCAGLPSWSYWSCALQLMRYWTSPVHTSRRGGQTFPPQVCHLLLSWWHVSRASFCHAYQRRHLFFHETSWPETSWPSPWLAKYLLYQD